MKLIESKAADYASWRAKNDDPYGSACFMFAAAWADLMEPEIEAGAKIEDIADRCCTEADRRFGVTGFMYSMAVQILAVHWVHGEALRLWHNIKNQIGNEGERANATPGVCLNTAVLSIGGEP